MVCLIVCFFVQFPIQSIQYTNQNFIFLLIHWMFSFYFIFLNDNHNDNPNLNHNYPIWANIMFQLITISLLSFHFTWLLMVSTEQFTVCQWIKIIALEQNCFRQILYSTSAGVSNARQSIVSALYWIYYYLIFLFFRNQTEKKIQNGFRVSSGLNSVAG